MNSLENRLTVANEMLSLLGSLQAEPFSATYDTMKAPSEIASENDESEDTIELLAKRKTSRSQERTDSEKKRKRK
jgi:hypothetical protein